MKTLAAFVFVSLFSLGLQAETVHLTSLSWPPYAEKGLPKQGASVAVARAAFASMGHELVVDFFPWSRAVKLAGDANSKYVGYFPEYHYESDEFLFSKPMGQGPLGLVENTASPITWTSVADLSQYSIGIVQDYVNTEELDAKIASGEIRAQAVVSDDKNVLKVGAGRVDAAVIDANVLSYLLKNDPSLKAMQGKVQMNSKLLVNKDLHIAFKHSPEGQKWLTIFNQGLDKIDAQAIMQSYLQSSEK
ncbi:substrate-binding periplasmic protein [Bowmanella dokdonensis]|uniref:Transporter substrate-binding domain-containing protein n=1 Tax=Bowmanella dokdonensis TaxID=751969 RepID=A0A939DMH0_9ALTE|nr:transporter substrate-binding domain-containing protein [Bowmanella dokdonensis]MBN7824526.1 transporter substrate-binding domain-containing protein [Bowmanella dokdonensis]